MNAMNFTNIPFYRKFIENKSQLNHVELQSKLHQFVLSIPSISTNHQPIIDPNELHKLRKRKMFGKKISSNEACIVYLNEYEKICIKEYFTDSNNLLLDIISVINAFYMADQLISPNTNLALMDQNLSTISFEMEAYEIDLWQFLNKNKQLSEEIITLILNQCIDLLNKISKLKFLYLDLKLNNFVINSSNYVVKIIDFDSDFSYHEQYFFQNEETKQLLHIFKVTNELSIEMQPIYFQIMIHLMNTFLTHHMQNCSSESLRLFSTRLNLKNNQYYDQLSQLSAQSIFIANEILDNSNNIRILKDAYCKNQ